MECSNKVQWYFYHDNLVKLECNNEDIPFRPLQSWIIRAPLTHIHKHTFRRYQTTWIALGNFRYPLGNFSSAIIWHHWCGSTTQHKQMWKNMCKHAHRSKYLKTEDKTHKCDLWPYFSVHISSFSEQTWNIFFSWSSLPCFFSSSSFILWKHDRYNQWM